MTDDRYLEQRMKEESANIKVDSYQKIASRGGWAGAGRTLWAISFIGAVTGAGMGLIAPFFPLVVGASSLAAAAAAIPAAVATFAAVGLSMGFAGGLMLGRISGATAAVAEENEKRMKQWTARQLLAANPEASIVPDAPVQPKPPQSYWQRAKDKYYTYVNPKLGMAFAAIGMAGGLIMAAAFLATGGAAGAVMPALETISGVPGIASNAAALTAFSAGVGGAFGAIFSFNYPKITSEVTHFFGDMLSGKTIGRPWEPPQEKTSSQSRPQAPEASMSEPQRQHASYAEMLASRAAEQLTLQPRR